MTNEEALSALKQMRSEIDQDNHLFVGTINPQMLDLAIAALERDRWIKITSRPMDEEERKEWSEKLGYDIEYEEALIYTSQLPCDGQEVLVCSQCGNIWKDTFNDDPDFGCSFEEHGDMDGIVAWMPIPEPPKEDKL